MKRDKSGQLNRRTFLAATSAVGAASFAAPTAGTPGREPGPKESEVLVGVSAGESGPSAVVESHVPEVAEIAHENPTLGYVAVAFPADADAARRAFRETITDRPRVKYAETNTTHRALYTPNDPRYPDQHVPQQVGADDAWDTTLGDCGCTIAIIDQGVQYDHPDLDYCSNPVAQYDFAGDDGDAYPVDLSTEYHGTAVAGVAAANTDNATGIAGISNSGLIVGRALDHNGSGSTSDIADAIQWAADQGADVINLSLGGGGYTTTMKNAVAYAWNNGSLLVGAAGGSGSNSVSYPAAYDEVMAVSAVDESGNLASFSSYGSPIEIAGPGTNVLTTTTTDRGSYETFSGTSFAAAAVSGVAALACAQWGLSGSELRRHLKATAKSLGLPASKQGCGLADAATAVTTDPASSGTCGGGGGGTCGDRSTSGGVDDSLTSSSDYDCWSWNWEYSDLCEVVVTLDGPTDADFDLYLSTATTSCPGPYSYDYRSISTNSQEQIVISNPNTSTPLQIDVESYSGSGSYRLDITEKST